MEYSSLVEQESISREHGVAAASESLNGDVDESVVRSWAGGEADLGAGKQLVQSRFALAQTLPLQRQHCGISFNFRPVSFVHSYTAASLLIPGLINQYMEWGHHLRMRIM